MLDTVHGLMKEVRTAAKRNILQENRAKLKDLGDFGKVQVGIVFSNPGEIFVTAICFNMLLTA